MKTRCTTSPKQIDRARYELAERFFVTVEQGKTQRFYDVVTGEDGVMAGALIILAYEQFDIEWNDAVQIVSTTRFKYLSPSALYRPTHPVVLSSGGLYFLNRWREPEVKALEGDVSPFLDHLEAVLGDAEKRDYLLDMLAWRFQNPNDKKPHIAFYFYHAEGGCGKSLFAQTLTKVMGASSVKTVNTVDAIGGKGAVETWACSWLIVEEAQVKRASSTYDIIKSYTGSDYVETDVKYKGFRRHEIPAMLMMMSNRPPSFIEQHDRRFFVSEWHLDLDDAPAYFAKYINWLESGGYEAIAFHLAYRAVSCDPYHAPPITLEKELAMAVTTNPVTQEIVDQLDDNPNLLAFNCDFFDGVWQRHKIYNTSRWAHELVAAGLVKDAGRYKVNCKQERLWLRSGAAILAGKGKKTMVVAGDGLHHELEAVAGCGATDDWL